MSINLVKGQRIDLTKGNSNLSRIIVGLGWDPVEQKKSFSLFGGSRSADVDCDASAILLKDNRIQDRNSVVYFGNLEVLRGGVSHTGDNLTGEGDGDDEQIIVSLDMIPETYDKIVFVVNIYDARKRNQHFGMIKNAYIRIADYSTNQELVRYNLSDDYSNKRTLITGEIYRHGNEWKFAAIGDGTEDNALGEIVDKYSN